MADGEATAIIEGDIAHKNWGAERFLERAMHVVPSVIYVFNQQTQSNEFTNRSIGAAMGYSEQEVQEMGSSLMATILHPEDAPKVFDHFDKIKKLADGDVLSLEYRTRHKDGHWVWLLSQDTVFDRTETGEVLRHIGTATDVTLQKAAEADAVEKRRSATAANKELASFAYSVSHDMKSPSNTLWMLLKEISHSHGTVLSQDGRQLIDYGLETVQKMQARIDDVVRYTRLIGQDAKHQSVSLDAVVAGVLMNFSETMERLDASVRVWPLPNVIGVEADLIDLFQCLVENALTFCPSDRRPKVEICATGSGDDGTVLVSVSDNGIGIPENQQESIFELFKRLHADSDYPGTGLGLAICRRIAAGHGGSITVKSLPGKGSTFTTALPAA